MKLNLQEIKTIWCVLFDDKL